jgi:mannose-6-phosphate isomerase-like protein (cupin superfamily)
VDPLRELFGVSALELFRKKELVATHGPLERFPAFMRQGPMESFDALSRHYSGPLEASQGSAENGVQIPVQGAHSSVLLRLGLTVFFSELRPALRDADGWLRTLEEALGLPDCASLSAFANAPGSGLAVHHDRFDQLFFQIRGEKHFRYAPNGFVENPDAQWSPFAASPPEWGQSYRHGFPLTTAELLALDFQTLALRPGSAFFLPAGTWHTTAEQQEEALSLVVAVRAPSRLEVLLNFARYYAGQSPEWRARPYGAWSSDPESARPEHAAFARLTSELGERLGSVPAQGAFDALSAHGFSIGTQSAYPRGARFERYVRLPNSSVRFEDDALPGKFRCVVSSGPTHRPQARTVVGFQLAARPVIDWVLEQKRAFTVDEAVERCPPFTREDVFELFGWLSHAALIRPLPVPDWDAP